MKRNPGDGDDRGGCGGADPSRLREKPPVMKACGESLACELKRGNLEQFSPLAFAKFGDERFEVSLGRTFVTLEAEKFFDVWGRVWHGGYPFQNSPR